MSENKPSQQCTICGAIQPLSAQTCSICGATLPGEPTTQITPVSATRAPMGTRQPYDFANGEDDLYAGDLTRRLWRFLVMGGIVIALAVGVGIGVVVSRMGEDNGGEVSVTLSDPGLTASGAEVGGPTAPPTATARAGSVQATRTPKPSMAFVTVTPAPPTATVTPTPGPCMQTAGAGDTVLGMAIRCGHQDMAVIELILEINGMASATELSEGQTIEIPWPTPTVNPEAPAEAEPTVGEAGAAAPVESSADETVVDTGSGDESLVNEFGTPDAAAAYANVEPTLRPGQAWHAVQPGETILSIAYDYGTSIEVLSQINPEVPFLQCDYGSPTGGENCSVMLYNGQRVRVPVPLPTPTFTPSPVGTLTPTPTATATFNAPYALSPEDGARFFADQQVTLRWGGTGTLANDQRYVVRVRDLATNEDYMALVKGTSYVLPGGWQPTDFKKHTFEWVIGIGWVNAQNELLSEDHLTEPRQFSWDSR